MVIPGNGGPLGNQFPILHFEIGVGTISLIMISDSIL